MRNILENACLVILGLILLAAVGSAAVVVLIDMCGPKCFM